MTELGRPILVTGAHRSGTTWIGKMIAASPGIQYIHEPFNVLAKSARGVDFQHQFTYITEENGELYYKQLKKILNFSLDSIEGMKKIRSLADLYDYTLEHLSFFGAKVLNSRPLLKDPIAVFSAEWLASKFNMDVVVCIRHPCAFVGSIKERNWTFNFRTFLNQPTLMRDHLHLFRDEMEKQVQEKHDIVDQAILLWKIIYHMVKKYRDKHDEWIFVRHEDLCLYPIKGFRNIYNLLGLDYNDKIINIIKKHSTGNSPSVEQNEMLIQRNSKDVIKNWLKRLTEDEIKRIRVELFDSASNFYTIDDW